MQVIMEACEYWIWAEHRCITAEASVREWTVGGTELFVRYLYNLKAVQWVGAFNFLLLGNEIHLNSWKLTGKFWFYTTFWYIPTSQKPVLMSVDA